MAPDMVTPRTINVKIIKLKEAEVNPSFLTTFSAKIKTNGWLK